MRKARCRAKYGRACPHGGHYGGKRRNRMSAAALPVHATGPKAPPKPQTPPVHETRKRTADANADA